MSASLRTRTISGLRWTLLNAVGEKVLSFGTTVVLARILDPAHFGIYALAFVAIDSLGIFKNLGVDAAIIQRKDRIEEAADTALFILPVIGTVLCALLYVSAPMVGTWMGHPEVSRPIQILGFSLILMSLGNVSSALIQRAMRFDIRTVANLAGMVVYAAVAIALARRGVGVWSLVIAYLLRWVVTIPVQWVMLGWVPTWRFDGALLREMIHFGKYVVGAWIIGFMVSNLDKMVIGRWLGTTALGYYSLCLGLSNIAASQLSSRIYQVAFPAFSEAQHAPDVVRSGFLKLTKYLFVCALPIAVLFALAPAELLHLAYGPNWVVAAGILQVLAIDGVAETVRTVVDSALMGCGRSRAVFAINLVQLIVLGVGSVSMAMRGSILGVAWAAVVASCLSCGLGLGAMMRQVGVRPHELVRDLWPAGLSTLLMAGAMMLVRHHLMLAGGTLILAAGWLIVLAGVGVLAYLGGILCWDRPVAHDLLHVLRLRASSASGHSS